MQSDLNRPLGQNNKSKSSSKNKNKPANQYKWLAGFAVVAIIAGASFTAFHQDPIETNTQTASADITESESTPNTQENTTDGEAIDNAQDVEQIQPGIIDRQAGNSGGNIETVTTSDGLKITKISPTERENEGAVLLDAPNQRGQDPHLAHLPDPKITEDTQFGRLPVYGQNGERAFDIYARPWSGARGVRIAIIVGGLGLSQTGSNYAIDKLPEDITLGFAGNGNSLQRWMQSARRNGHEIILQVPFEPFDYPNNNPGRGTLVTTNDPVSNLGLLHEAMGRITNYTGIGNFMGGRFLSDPEALEPVMRDVARRGILFFDDGTSSRSLTETFSKTLGVPFVAADIVLDVKPQKGEVLQKLDDLERIARRNGFAVGTASAFTDSVDAIAEWSNEAKARGIEIVGLSAVATDPNTR
jgi:hypothetical protein